MRHTVARLSIVVLLCTSSNLISQQIHTEEWALSYDSPDGLYDVANHLTADSESSVWVIGSSRIIGGDSDVSLLKFSPTGQLVVEERYTGGDSISVTANNILVDEFDNVYIAGFGYRDGFIDYFVFVRKYDSEGMFLWEATQPDPVRVYNMDIQLDSENNILLGTNNGYGEEFFANFQLAKLSSEGEEIWSRQYEGMDSDGNSLSSFVVDEDGNVYLLAQVGYMIEDGLIRRNMEIIKVNSSGYEVWREFWTYHQNSDDVPNKILLDSAGDIIAVGDTDRFLNNSGHCEIMVHKYNPDGDLLWWSLLQPQEEAIETPTDAIIDGADNIIVTGESYRTFGDYPTQVVMAKFDAEGDLLWQNNHIDADGSLANGHGLAIDNENNIYVAGHTSASDLTLKFDPDGNKTWIGMYLNDESAWGRTYDIVLSQDGSVFVSGYSEQSSNRDFFLIKYDQSVLSLDDDAKTSRTFLLEQNYPNPFNPTTTIRYNLAESAEVTLRIYDLNGKLIRTLVEGQMQSPNQYTISWDGTNQLGLPATSGVYIYRLTTAAHGAPETRKMVLVR